MGHPAEPVRFWRRRLRVLDVEAGNDADMRVGRVHDGLGGAGKIAFCPLGHLVDIAFDFAPDDRLDPGYRLVHCIHLDLASRRCRLVLPGSGLPAMASVLLLRSRTEHKHRISECAYPVVIQGSFVRFVLASADGTALRRTVSGP